MFRIYAIVLGIAAFIASIDQWSKSFFTNYFKNLGDSFEVTSWFDFTLVHNKGIAFGMLRDIPDPYRFWVLTLLPIAVLILLWFSFVRQFKTSERLGPIAIGLVFGGAIGNLIDRARLGYVVDFVDWHYPSTGECLAINLGFVRFPLFSQVTGHSCHWPAFNIADAAICIAFILLIILSFKQEKKSA